MKGIFNHLNVAKPVLARIKNFMLTKLIFSIVITSITLTICTPKQLFAQRDTIDYFANKICQCTKNKQYETMEEMQPCFNELIVNHLSEIMSYYGKESFSDDDIYDFSGAITAKLMKNCPYYFKLLQNGSDNQSGLYKIDSSNQNTCKGPLIGNYYYVLPGRNGTLNDTTFVTFTNHEYIEYMENKTYFSKLKLSWEDACNFELTFVESDHVVKKHLSKPGDRYNYKIIQTKDNSIVLSTYIQGTEYRIEFIKLPN